MRFTDVRTLSKGQERLRTDLRSEAWCEPGRGELPRALAPVTFFYATVFDRAEAMGLVCVGPQAPNGRQAQPWPSELPSDSCATSPDYGCKWLFLQAGLELKVLRS